MWQTGQTGFFEEAGGQYVQQEATDEFDGVQGHLLDLVVILGVSPAERRSAERASATSTQPPLTLPPGRAIQVAVQVETNFLRLLTPAGLGRRDRRLARLLDRRRCWKPLRAKSTDRSGARRLAIGGCRKSRWKQAQNAVEDLTARLAAHPRVHGCWRFFLQPVIMGSSEVRSASFLPHW